MATHSSILAWSIPGTGSPGGLPCLWGRTESDMTEVTEHACMHIYIYIYVCIYVITFMSNQSLLQIESVSYSVVFNSLLLHGLQPARLF